MNKIDRFKKEIQDFGLPVVVDFFSQRCSPCRMMAPILEELADELEGRAGVVTVDVQEDPELAEHFRINAVPTMIVFKNGQEVGRLIGLQSKQALIDALGDRP